MALCVVPIDGPNSVTSLSCVACSYSGPNCRNPLCSGRQFSHDVDALHWTQLADLLEADLNLSVCRFFAYRVSFDLPHLASDLVGDPELRKQLSGEVDAAGAIGKPNRFVAVREHLWFRALAEVSDRIAMPINLEEHVCPGKVGSKVADIGSVRTCAACHHYHGAIQAGVTTGSIVYVAGAGLVGLACAAYPSTRHRQVAQEP
jgi:hypothetical protein